MTPDRRRRIQPEDPFRMITYPIKLLPALVGMYADRYSQLSSNQQLTDRENGEKQAIHTILKQIRVNNRPIDENSLTSLANVSESDVLRIDEKQVAFIISSTRELEATLLRDTNKKDADGNTIGETVEEFAGKYKTYREFALSIGINDEERQRLLNEYYSDY